MHTAIIAAAAAAAVVTGGTAVAGSHPDAATEVNRTNVACVSTDTAYPESPNASSTCVWSYTSYPQAAPR